MLHNNNKYQRLCFYECGAILASMNADRDGHGHSQGPFLGYNTVSPDPAWCRNARMYRVDAHRIRKNAVSDKYVVARRLRVGVGALDKTLTYEAGEFGRCKTRIV